MEEKKNTMSAHFISLNEFVENPGFLIEDEYKYVKYGIDNKLPYQLIEYYRNVGLHRAIIDKKSKMFVGQGFDIDIDDEKKAQKTLDFLENINPFETFNEILEKSVLDINIFGGVYYQIIWEKSGKKIKEIYHMPYEQMRAGKKDKFGQVRNYFYNISEDVLEQWDAYTDVKEKNIKQFPAFNKEINKSKPQIAYFHKYEPGFNYYSLPDYIGALRDLNTLAAISDFHNANIHNNMQPGLTIMFTGPEPDKTTKDAIVKQIKSKYGNTNNAGRPMVFFLENDQEIKMEQPEVSDVSKMYDLLSNDVKENIIVSHQIPRAVAALSQPGSLGNNKEIIEGMEMVRLNYIEPLQENFLSKWNKFMSINGLEDVKLNSPSPNLMKYTLQELQTVLTPTEVREYIGKEVVGDEQIQEDIQKDIEEDVDPKNNPQINE